MLLLLSLPPAKKRRNRKKAYYIPVNSLPRILKRDIRREYARMLTNVYNSADEELVDKFFNHFCVPSFQSVLYTKNSSKSRPAIKFTHGIKPSIIRTVEGISNIPDIIFQIQQTQIIRKDEYTGCSISISMGVNCTPLFVQECEENININDEIAQRHHEIVHYYGLVDGENCDMNTPWILPNVQLDSTCDAKSIVEEATQHINNNTASAVANLQQCWICQSMRNSYIKNPMSTKGIFEIEMRLDAENRLYRLDFYTD